MDRIRHHRLTTIVAALYALAMVLLGFAHQPMAGVAQTLPSYDRAAYALPDGSLPELCDPSGTGSDPTRHVVACDACLVASGHGPLSPPPRVVQPASLVIDTLALAQEPARVGLGRERARVRDPPAVATFVG